MSMTVSEITTGVRQGDPSAENLYDVLGVSEFATPDDVKRAYFALVRKYRPNENPEAFQKFNDARWVLEDSPRRNKYDQMRRHGRRLKSLLDDAESAAKTDPEKAIPHLRSAVALAPALPLPRALLADVHLRLEEWSGAERQLQWLVRDSERDEQLRYRLALCLYRMGKWNDSEEHLSAALAVNPLYHDALMLLARVYDAMKRIARAITTLEKAIENDGVEDYLDLDALLHLLALNSLSRNDRGVEKTSQRVIQVLGKAGDTESLRGVRRIYEKATEQFEQESRGVAVEMLRLAKRIPTTDDSLKQAVETLLRRARLADEARIACNDKALPPTLRAYVQMTFLDHAEDPRRNTRIAALQSTLKAERDASKDVTHAALDRLRQLFPGIASEEAAFFDSLQQGTFVSSVVPVAPVPQTVSPRSRADLASVNRASDVAMPVIGMGRSMATVTASIVPADALPTANTKRVVPTVHSNGTTSMPTHQHNKEQNSWWLRLLRVFHRTG